MAELFFVPTLAVLLCPAAYDARIPADTNFIGECSHYRRIMTFAADRDFVGAAFLLLCELSVRVARLVFLPGKSEG